jgi:hypothetical protein
MVVIQLNDNLYEYLQHVVKGYAGAGLNPDECLAMYHVWQAMKAAQRVDEGVLRAATHPTEPPAPVESEKGA